MLVSIHHLNTLMIIEQATGAVAWEYGAGVLDGQHNATLLDNGNVLVFDNRDSQSGSRLVEIDPFPFTSM